MLLLESGQPCTLKVWNLKNAEIIIYRDAVCTGKHWRGGTHTVRLPQSHLFRTFRDITLHEINGYEVIR